MGVTIKDIATKAGVSLATVSRVLNSSGYVSDQAKQRVFDAVKELNYIPNAAARSLSKKETKVIGVMIPESDNPFFGEILKGITEVADQNDLGILLCHTNEDERKQEKAFLMLREQRIKGLIMTPVYNQFSSESVRLLEAFNIPIVIVDREADYFEFDGVFLDNAKGAFEGVTALIKEGHRKIAIITGDLELKIGQERLMGYKKALTIHNIPIDEQYIFYGDFTLEAGYRLTKEILVMDNPPTAIFVCNNMMNLGCIKAILKAGKHIPEDIALVAFDKIDVLDIFNLDISVIARDSVKMGEIAMEMLMERMTENKADEGIKKIILPTELILKGSEKYIK